MMEKKAIGVRVRCTIASVLCQRGGHYNMYHGISMSTDVRNRDRFGTTLQVYDILLHLPLLCTLNRCEVIQ